MAHNIFHRLGIQDSTPERGGIFQDNRDAIIENFRQDRNIADSLTVGAQSVGAHETQTNLALNAGLHEATRIRDEENAIRLRENAAVTEAEGRFNAFETISDEDIDTFAGQNADRAGADANQLLANLREAMGGAGTSGGDARRGATDIELARFGNLSQVRGNLKIFQANAAAKDAINRYQASLSASDRRREGPSVFLSDQINTFTGVKLTQQGLADAREASRRAADAAKDAGKINAFGGFAGAAFNFGAAAFGG